MTEGQLWPVLEWIRDGLFELLGGTSLHLFDVEWARIAVNCSGAQSALHLEEAADDWVL